MCYERITYQNFSFKKPTPSKKGYRKIKKRANYRYDALNRITSGFITNSNSSENNKHNLKLVEYDKNGNITKLRRNGYRSDGVFDEYLDQLTYNYDSGNKLLDILEEGHHYEGFSDGSNTQTGDYTYDLNGNLMTDANKGITNISYNYLNLPETITINNNPDIGIISYIYDATGVKLQKTINNTGESSVTTTDYAGNFVYENNTLQFFNHAEGYVTPNGSSFDYVYQYKDHLGNIRLSYKDVSLTSTPNLEIVEENNYYPFGLKHKGYNNIVNGTAHPYKYNGKEHNQELGLDWYDYGARNYQHDLGRWMNIDPLADKYVGLSPYNFAANSPILLTDPDGRDIIFSWQRDKDNNITGINITITGKVIDNTTKKGLSERKLNKLRDKIINGLTSSIKSSDKKFNVNVTANIGVAKSESDFTKTDHAFRIVDNVDTAIGKTDDPNKETLGASKGGENYVYLSKNFTEKTVAHEVGHSAGLDHIKAERKNGKYGKPIDYWGFSSTGKRYYRRYTTKFYPGNLMHQQSDPSPGNKLVRWQFNKMLEKYKNNELNNGKQKK